MLVMSADGDARKLLNNLEITAQAATTKKQAEIDVTLLKETLGDAMRRFDNKGVHFYDQISALHKSVRGSHPDAALYWFTRMLDGGVDPRYLARRIIRMAWEDIGLADPRAAQIANEAALTYERLGSRKANWRWRRLSSTWLLPPRAMQDTWLTTRPDPL